MWDKSLFGRVYLNGIVQQSYYRGLWFITFSVADSLQNAILCQEGAEEFVVETVRTIQKKSKDGNKLPLRALHCKKQGISVKQYGMCFLNHTCHSKLSQRQQKLLFFFFFALFKNFLFLYFTKLTLSNINIAHCLCLKTNKQKTTTTKPKNFQEIQGHFKKLNKD